MRKGISHWRCLQCFLYLSFSFDNFFFVIHFKSYRLNNMSCCCCRHVYIVSVHTLISCEHEMNGTSPSSVCHCIYACRMMYVFNWNMVLCTPSNCNGHKSIIVHGSILVLTNTIFARVYHRLVIFFFFIHIYF